MKRKSPKPPVKKPTRLTPLEAELVRIIHTLIGVVAASPILLFKKLEHIMAKIDDLNTKVDELQTALDAEQATITAAIQALDDQIAVLTAQLESGATPEQLQAVIDKLDATKTDLEGTVA